ncbi:MAG: 50S ribosomal protein L21 [Solirubrobacterales bacterium]
MAGKRRPNPKHTDMTSTYAIVESGGKQYRAEKGTTLVVDRLTADEGAKVNLRPVMFRSDGDVVLDRGDLEKVKVEATVAGHERGEKVRVFKYRPKKGYRRRAGHRSELTRLEVTEVKLLTRKPDGAEKPKPATKKPAAKKQTATKPAAKKGTTRKAASTRKTSSTRPKKDS